MNRRHVVMALALTAAAGLAVFGDTTPVDDLAEPVVRGATNAPRALSKTATGVGATKVDAMILALKPRGIQETGDRIAAAATLFGEHSWTPPPAPPKPAPPPVVPPPSAPPMPFTYLGKKIDAGVWEAYLARGEQTFIVQEKSVIEGVYRIDTILPPTLTMTYLPLNQRQTLVLGAGE